jgi:hypothetical protein
MCVCGGGGPVTGSYFVSHPFRKEWNPSQEPSGFAALGYGRRGVTKQFSRFLGLFVVIGFTKHLTSPLWLHYHLKKSQMWLGF